MSLTKNTFEALSIFARVQNFLAHNNLEMFFGQCFLSNVDSKYHVLALPKTISVGEVCGSRCKLFFFARNLYPRINIVVSSAYIL